MPDDSLDILIRIRNDASGAAEAKAALQRLGQEGVAALTPLQGLFAALNLSHQQERLLLGELEGAFAETSEAGVLAFAPQAAAIRLGHQGIESLIGHYKQLQDAAAESAKSFAAAFDSAIGRADALHEALQKVQEKWDETQRHIAEPGKARRKLSTAQRDPKHLEPSLALARHNQEQANQDLGDHFRRQVELPGQSNGLNETGGPAASADRAAEGEGAITSDAQSLVNARRARTLPRDTGAGDAASIAKLVGVTTKAVLDPRQIAELEQHLVHQAQRMDSLFKTVQGLEQKLKGVHNQ